MRGILPPSLVRDLRVMADQGRSLAREKHGPQAQRLQPLAASGLDLRAYQDYVQLPALNEALQRVLSSQHTLSGAEWAGILYEPSEQPACTSWHRDITEASPGIDVEEFRVISRDPTFFAQVNCALYSDCCTWYVPGSDGRPNTPGEMEVVLNPPDWQSAATDVEAERMQWEYCTAMPGAVQLVLEPGDFALYCHNGWHLGNYAPYRKRATIHDGALKPETRAWYQRWFATTAPQ